MGNMVVVVVVGVGEGDGGGLGRWKREVVSLVS